MTLSESKKRSSGRTGRVATKQLRAFSVRLSDRLAESIEAQILHCELREGDLLPSEADLCEGFGVSRTVVRDALRTLDARGLVKARSGRGTIVLAPSEASLKRAVISRLMRSDLTYEDVLRARAAIDINLGPLAATRALPGQIAAMREMFDAFASAIAAEAWDEASSAHVQFHVRLLDATDLPALRMILSPMQQVVMLSALPLKFDWSDVWRAEIKLHQGIMIAVEARDKQALSAAIARHYESIAAYPDQANILFRDVSSVDDMLRVNLYAD